MSDFTCDALKNGVAAAAAATTAAAAATAAAACGVCNYAFNLLFSLV